MPFTLMRTFCLCLLALCLSLASICYAGTLTIGGTGSAGPIIRLLFNEFRKSSPETELVIIDPPLGTGGAIQALTQGKADLVFFGRELHPEEKNQFGQSFPVAHTPLVLASRDGLHGKGFTFNELADIYAGRLTQWDNGQPIRLLLRSSVDSDTLALCAMSAAMKNAVVQASQRQGMVIADNDLETLEMIVKTPGSLGPTTLGLLSNLKMNARVFSLDGRQPSVAALQNGSYPWHKTLTAVLPHRPKAEALLFAEFLRSSKARALLMHNDYLPATP